MGIKRPTAHRPTAHRPTAHRPTAHAFTLINNFAYQVLITSGQAQFLGIKDQGMFNRPIWMDATLAANSTMNHYKWLTASDGQDSHCVVCCYSPLDEADDFRVDQLAARGYSIFLVAYATDEKD